MGVHSVHGLKISAVLIPLFCVGLLVARPMATRGQIDPLPASRITLPVRIVQPTPVARLASLTGSVTASATSLATTTVAASALELDGKPMPAGRAASAYPLPERNYIASGLWKVGHTELGNEYHTFDCKALRAVSRNHVYGFPEWREALVAGYQPAFDCTPSPLRELIDLVRDERRRVAQTGQLPSAIGDSKLIEIRQQAGADSVSEKVLNRVFGRMLGRAVAMPAAQAAGQAQAGSSLSIGRGGDEGLPEGMMGGMGMPGMGGMGGVPGSMGGAMGGAMGPATPSMGGGKFGATGS